MTCAAPTPQAGWRGASWAIASLLSAGCCELRFPVKLSHERFFHVVASLKSSDGVEKEQRRQPRVGMRAAVLIAPLVDGGEPGTPYSVRVHDISSEGCSFQHVRALCKGAQFLIDLPEA